LLVAAGALWFASLASPIPSGMENVEKARAFLKVQFPDREVARPTTARRRSRWSMS
jgi:hypothetical protein